MQLLTDQAALARIAPSEIEALTEAATAATFYGAPLSDQQIGANRRVVTISTRTCEAAAASADNTFIAAFIDDRLPVTSSARVMRPIATSSTGSWCIRTFTGRPCHVR